MSLRDVSLNLVETYSDAEDFMRWLGERRPVLGADSETGGLEWFKYGLRLVQFGDAQTGWAIPWDDWAGLVREVWRRYDGTYVFHNAAFDLRFWEEAGAPVAGMWPRTHDTSVAAALLGYHGFARRLKDLSVELVDRNAQHGQDALKKVMAKHHWGWDTVPVGVPAYWCYSALDPVLAARLWEKLEPRIRADEGLTNVYELEMSVSRILSAMTRRGLPLDKPYVLEKIEAMSRYEHEMEIWLRANWPQFRRETKEGVEFTTLNNDQIAQILLADGMPLTKLTDTGKYSVDDSVLKGLVDKHPLASAVQKYRQARKFRSTFFEGFLKYEHEGRVIAGVNPLGARTGRKSSSNPNLQNLPSRGGPLVRNAFRAREGHKLVSIDYDQIEWRMFAHYANAQGMIDAIHAGEDIHKANARLVWGEERAAEMRSAAKTIGFSFLFGAGIEKMAVQLGMATAATQRVRDEFNRAIPDISRFSNELQQVVQRRAREDGTGYIRTLAGRKTLVDTGKWYTGLNYLCQGSAADVFKNGLVELDRRGLSEYALLPIHDELMSEVPEKEADDFLREASEAMADRSNFVVPIEASGEILTCWGEKYA